MNADSTIPKLPNEELVDLRNRGYEFVTYLPQFSNLKEYAIPAKKSGTGVT